jgi:hypothetical protein
MPADAVGLDNEIAQSRALRHGCRDIADDEQAPLILLQLLDKRSGQAAAQLQKLRIEPLDRNDDNDGARAERLAQDIAASASLPSSGPVASSSIASSFAQGNEKLLKNS